MELCTLCDVYSTVQPNTCACLQGEYKGLEGLDRAKVEGDAQELVGLRRWLVVGMVCVLLSRALKRPLPS